MSGPEINSYATGWALPEALEACPEPCREAGGHMGAALRVLVMTV